MASLPRKGVKGENFKAWAVDSINKLIDYLSSPYLQNGKGIAIRRTPSGTIIELEKPQSVQNVSISGGTGGGGGGSGLFPFYPGSVTIPSITPGTVYSADQDFWLIGWILQSSSIQTAGLTIRNSAETGTTYIPLSSSTSATDSMSYLVCIPIPANRKFFLNSTLPSYACNLGAYGTTTTGVTLTTYI